MTSPRPPATTSLSASARRPRQLALIRLPRLHRQINLLLPLLLSLVLPAPAAAHGGEDHGAPASAPTAAPPTAITSPAQPSEAPQRLADGSLWIPKAAQRRLGLRTWLAQIKSHPQVLSLNGQVRPDPNAGGKVQASQAGRIEAGPQGLAVLGQKVRQGQVLAWLRPVASSLERGNQQAALAELASQLALAERKLARYEQLEGALPQKDIEAARIERDALLQRRAAVAASLQQAEPLRAPVSGEIISAQAALGQVVDAKELLFEIADPQRLVLEALAYPTNSETGSAAPALPPTQPPAGSLASAALPGGGAARLQLIGQSAALREQARPMLFRVLASDTPLAIGQWLPITLALTVPSGLSGVAVPRAALGRNAAGEPIVWLHVAPERFAARVVRQQPLDASQENEGPLPSFLAPSGGLTTGGRQVWGRSQVLLTTGVHDGDRVVTEGASLLAQLR